MSNPNTSRINLFLVEPFTVGKNGTAADENEFHKPLLFSIFWMLAWWNGEDGYQRPTEFLRAIWTNPKYDVLTIKYKRGQGIPGPSLAKVLQMFSYHTVTETYSEKVQEKTDTRLSRNEQYCIWPPVDDVQRPAPLGKELCHQNPFLELKTTRQTHEQLPFVKE